MPLLAGFLGGQSCLPLSWCHLLVPPMQQRQFLQHNSILISWHRSHFGSRYTLGCCGHASLFCAGSIPAAFTLLQQQGKLCAVTSGLFAELHFWRLPPWLPNPAQSSTQHAQYRMPLLAGFLGGQSCLPLSWCHLLVLPMQQGHFLAQFKSDLLAP